MAPMIPNGRYIVSTRNDRLAVERTETGAQLHIYNGMETATWVLENLPNGRVTLKHEGSGKYAGIPEDKIRGIMPARLSEAPLEYVVHPGEEPQTFKLCVPAEAGKYFLGYHPVLIFPPWAGLVPENMGAVSWKFESK